MGGRERLRLLARVMRPTTLNLFSRVGIEREMEISEPQECHFVSLVSSLNLINRSLSASRPAGASGNDDSR
jgi:hypothetical protein